MDFVTKTTLELSIEEKKRLVDLFNEILVEGKPEKRSLVEFDNQFLQNCVGYSFHTLMSDNGEIVGSNTMVPSIYLIDGKEYKFVNSVDTMIHKKARGIENFYDMIKESFSFCGNLGYDIVYGFPNDNSYPLFKGCKFMRDVDSLYTYCLPYRIGGIKKGFNLFNWASKAFCWTYLCVNSLFASKRIASYRIEKESSRYNATRYKREDGQYEIIHFKGVDFMYKIKEYEGVRAAFLIDVVQKSAKNFCMAASYILKHSSKDFDILLYIGYLPFSWHGFVQVPHKIEPKKFNFTAGFLNKCAVGKEDLLDINNWDVNLSNYDLI